LPTQVEGEEEHESPPVPPLVDVPQTSIVPSVIPQEHVQRPLVDESINALEIVPEGNGWRKSWAWIFSLEDEPPLSRVVWSSSPQEGSVTEGNGQGSDSYAPCSSLSRSNSSGSGSSDSTDSGKIYFI
jgi:hypothetical protein